MMETGIFVLKAIGIGLALLLAAAVLLLFLALFCRVRYDVAVDAGETVTGKVRFRWLWFVVRFSLAYDDGDTVWALRVLGIPIKRKKASGAETPERQGKTAEAKKGKDKGGKKKNGKEAAGMKPEAQKQEKMSLEAVKKRNVETQARVSSEAGLAKQNLESREDALDNEEKPGGKEILKEEKGGQETVWKRISSSVAKLFAKIRGFLLKIQGIFDTIRNIGKKTAGFIKDLPELLQNIRDKKDSAVWFLKDKHVRAFLQLSKTQLGYLLVHLKPKKAQGLIRFGTGNPCSTGQILGAAAMAYPLYASWLHVIPEFEEKHFSGYLKARGKIRLFRVILIGKRWFLADTSKRCLNKWNKLKEELTNGR